MKVIFKNNTKNKGSMKAVSMPEAEIIKNNFENDGYKDVLIIEDWESEFEDKHVSIDPDNGQPWLIGDYKNFISTQIIEKLIEDIPETPENWDKWSIERQLGYNRAIVDYKQHLRDKWL